MNERQQIEREVLAITIGPRPIVDALVDLILEHRAAEIDAFRRANQSLNSMVAERLLERARELRALKGTAERSK